MKIDRRLHLVVPIYDDNLETVRAYVHSTPIPRELFETYFMIISQTFSAIFTEGLNVAGGPGCAMVLMKQLALKKRVWEDDVENATIGVKNGLVQEIRRLTNVIVPADRGWQQVPLHVAVDRGMIDAEDAVEVENAIVFFIVVSAVMKRSQRGDMLASAAGVWDARITSSNSTEFMSSLTTSTGTASSGAKPLADAIVDSGNATATADGKPLSLPR